MIVYILEQGFWCKCTYLLPLDYYQNEISTGRLGDIDLLSWCTDIMCYTLNYYNVRNWSWWHTLLVVEDMVIPCGDAMVDSWPLFLKTVNRVFIKDDFPAPILPMTMMLMDLHGSGGEISRIFLNSLSFVFN